MSLRGARPCLLHGKKSVIVGNGNRLPVKEAPATPESYEKPRPNGLLPPNKDARKPAEPCAR